VTGLEDKASQAVIRIARVQEPEPAFVLLSISSPSYPIGNEHQASLDGSPGQHHLRKKGISRKLHVAP